MTAMATTATSASHVGSNSSKARMSQLSNGQSGSTTSSGLVATMDADGLGSGAREGDSSVGDPVSNGTCGTVECKLVSSPSSASSVPAESEFTSSTSGTRAGCANKTTVLANTNNSATCDREWRRKAMKNWRRRDASQATPSEQHADKVLFGEDGNFLLVQCSLAVTDHGQPQKRAVSA